MKKVIFIVISILLVIIVFLKISDYFRLKKIIDNIFVQKVDSHITLLNSKEEFFTDSYEKYVYKIINTKKVNCNLLKHEKTYINDDKSYCMQNFTDNYGRNISVVIENNILTVEVFID